MEAIIHLGPSARAAVPTLIALFQETKDQPKEYYSAPAWPPRWATWERMPKRRCRTFSPCCVRSIPMRRCALPCCESGPRKPTSAWLCGACCALAAAAAGSFPAFFMMPSSSRNQRLAWRPISSLCSRTTRKQRRQRAALSLGLMGPKAKAAALSLKNALKDEHASVRHQAVLALEAVDPVEAEAAVPVLAEAVLGGLGCAPEGFRVRSGATGRAIAAAAALERIGAPARSALPALQQALTANNVNLRVAAAQALAVIEPKQADVAVTTLTPLLKQDEFPRSLALPALGVIGPGAKAAVPMLLELAGNKNPSVSREAVEALKKIDPEAAAQAGIR